MVLVLRHMPREDLGAIASHLSNAGLTWEYLDTIGKADSAPAEIAKPDLRRLAGMIVLGGPMNVDEVEKYPVLGQELQWIREVLTLGLPLLGVCLGAQLLAKALGARVYPNQVKEIGWYELEMLPATAEDPLFAGCAQRGTVFQWHGDTFDLPPGARRLARSAQCRHQAFSYGPAAYGLQFHIEMTAEMIDDWLAAPENCAELAAFDYIAPAAILAATAESLPKMRLLGDRVLSRFAAQCRSFGEAKTPT